MTVLQVTAGCPWSYRGHPSSDFLNTGCPKNKEIFKGTHFQVQVVGWKRKCSGRQGYENCN